MFHVKTLNAIAEQGLAQLNECDYTVADHLTDYDALLLRSADIHKQSFSPDLKVVGRAGAGTNNIPLAALTAAGIPVLNTPGANANAVKELVLTGLLLASRHVCSAWDYMRGLTGTEQEQHTAVEAAKKQFVGGELPGKTLAIIGLGHVGIEVANCARGLGMRVVGYDPALSVKNAWKLRSSVIQAESLAEAVQQADFVSLHVPLLSSTANLISHELLQKMPQGVVILNFARSGIVDHDALSVALEQKRVSHYVCDFPVPQLRDFPQVICLPHLGASTTEAQENCAVMAVSQVKQFLETGNIINSVNFPDLKMPINGYLRIAIVNQNVPNMVAQITQVFSEHGINIIELVNKSRENVAYTMIDIERQDALQLVAQLQGVEGVIRVRSIQ